MDRAYADRRAPVRREGFEKLTGATLYTDDLVVPGAWYGATVRSTEPHARLLGIDLDPAFDWSGVVVVTAADIPGENVVASIALDQPALVADEIRHVAEAVALIAAPDPALARAARDAVHLRTEPLPAVLDPLLSTAACKAFEIARGDLEEGFAAADLVVEGTYRTGHQEQLYIEPQAMIAIPREDGGIEVHGSLQCPYYVHSALVRALALEADRVVVIQEETGGGFGGKEDFPSQLAIHASLLARKAGRPVRMVYDRHEDLAATTKRHPSVVRHRTGVMRDGTLVAQDIEFVLDAGAYTTLSPVVVSRGAIHAGGPYRCPNVRIQARAAMTNTPPNGAFRGFGAPQSEFAAELHLSRVAEALGLSPLEIRRRNAYREGDTTATGQVLRESVAALDVLEAAAEAAEFERVRARHTAQAGAAGPDARSSSGIGIALGWHGAGFTGSGEAYLASVATVEVTADGAILALAAITEMGQGARTVLAQVVAEALGVAPEAVEVVKPDTSRVPNTGPTVASRSTMMGGGLLATAAAHLRSDVEAATGRPFADSYRDFARDRGELRATEQFHGFPGIEWDDATYRGDAYPAYSWACAVAAVDVDRDTGEVRVRSVIQAVDAGRIINPVLAEGQVEGATLQAVGYATTEEIQLRDGAYRNDRMTTYLIPTALDAPRIETILIERPFSGVPHGAKGLGELPMDIPAPAVVAAIHDATGVWIADIPATPEKVLAAILARVTAADR
ncbi:MAG TPA: xanthine dehydrogenase family protein molybdopterin-binding subunit [Candidatus Limnocylindrales bacterium]|nr:xanthine dehydrogenase family protein molybdopterin-binding subunit [Candidatus Limnocylindrales bacterium]